MKRLVLIGVAIGIVLSACISCAPNAEKEKAVIVAEKWLTLLDTGKYSEGWQEAGEYIRSSVKQDQWVQMLQSVRTPLGKVISRKLKTKTYKMAISDPFFIIQFETFFQNNKSTIETVRVQFNKNGWWRVDGYGLN